MKYKKVNIAIVGFGNIGSYFYKTLQKNIKTISIKTGRTPIVKYICAKNINKKRKVKLPKTKWIKDDFSAYYRFKNPGIHNITATLMNSESLWGSEAWSTVTLLATPSFILDEHTKCKINLEEEDEWNLKAFPFLS